jgi:hypothetical protein
LKDRGREETSRSLSKSTSFEPAERRGGKTSAHFTSLIVTAGSPSVSGKYQAPTYPPSFVRGVLL